MNYIDVYFARRNHMGDDIQEIAHSRGERSFDKWLKESPHTVKNLSVERGLYFPGLILSKKDEVGKKTLTLNVSSSVPIHTGDILNWQVDGELEKWILYKKERKVNEFYQVFDIIKCNYLLKWVDGNGILQSSWVYFVSSLDSKIKENFRTWNSLITPQPNKYAELIMPNIEVDKQTKFIIGKEAWYAVEYDVTSVKGITYLSLTEDRVNYIYDDVENGIANSNDLAKYTIETSDKLQSFNIGDEIKPVYTIQRNGKNVDEEVIIESMNKKIAVKKDDKIIAVGIGEVELLITLVKYPSVQLTQKIAVTKSKKNLLSFIDGDDSICLNREKKYKVINSNGIVFSNNFSLSDNTMASVIDNKDGSCTVKANDVNKIGTVVLYISCDDTQYSKEIKIIPLW